MLSVIDIDRIVLIAYITDNQKRVIMLGEIKMEFTILIRGGTLCGICPINIGTGQWFLVHMCFMAMFIIFVLLKMENYPFKVLSIGKANKCGQNGC